MLLKFISCCIPIILQDSCRRVQGQYPNFLLHSHYTAGFLQAGSWGSIQISCCIPITLQDSCRQGPGGSIKFSCCIPIILQDYCSVLMPWKMWISCCIPMLKQQNCSVKFPATTAGQQHLLQEKKGVSCPQKVGNATARMQDYCSKHLTAGTSNPRRTQ